jgi:hypothetical protein
VVGVVLLLPMRGVCFFPILEGAEERVDGAISELGDPEAECCYVVEGHEHETL